jgi:hypothetical protein
MGTSLQASAPTPSVATVLEDLVANVSHGEHSSRNYPLATDSTDVL